MTIDVIRAFLPGELPRLGKVRFGRGNQWHPIPDPAVRAPAARDTRSAGEGTGTLHVQAGRGVDGTIRGERGTTGWTGRSGCAGGGGRTLDEPGDALRGSPGRRSTGASPSSRTGSPTVGGTRQAIHMAAAAAAKNRKSRRIVMALPPGRMQRAARLDVRPGSPGKPRPWVVACRLVAGNDYPASGR